MRTLFDLPSHAFFIHLPLVLVPFSALAMAVLAARPAWRHRYGPALVVATFIGAVSTIIATISGNEFNEVISERLGPIADDHKALGETTRLLTIGFFIAVTAMVAVDRSGDERIARPPVQWSLTVLSVGLGVLAAVWMFRTGHEGARIVWDGVIPEDG